MVWIDKEKLQVLIWIKKEQSKFEKWLGLDERVRFVTVGAVNMGLRYLLFVVLGWAFTTLHYQVILVLTWIISSFWAFLTYKFLVFRTEGNHLKEYLKSVAVWCVSYLINAGMLEIFTGWLGFNVYISQAVAIVLVLVSNYLLFKHFAFRQKKKLSWWEKAASFFDIFAKKE